MERGAFAQGSEITANDADWRPSALRRFFSLWLLALGLMLAMTIFVGVATTSSNVLIVANFLITAASIGLVRKHRSNTAVTLFSGWIVVSVVILMLTRYGLRTPAITLLATPLLLTSFFLGSRYSGLIAGICGASLLIVYMLQTGGWLVLPELPIKPTQLLVINIVAIALVATLSQVAARGIETSQQRLVAQNVELLRTRAELEDQMAERHVLLTQLQQSNQELIRFSHMSAHDLREPLRTITNFSTLLEERSKVLDAKERQMLRFVSEAASRMHLLVGALLEYAKLGDEKTVPDTAVSVDALLNDVEQELGALIEQTSGRIERSPCPPTNGDESLLKLIFQNLIGNGLKYHRQDVPPIVTITGKREGKMVRYEIADNGVGIPEEHYERVFEIFERLPHTDGRKGAGLGLATVSKIARMHGGSIKVRSDIDVGSVFTVTLPATAADRPSQLQIH